VATRILVAMSGGVDSSVAAARLCAAGFEVVGVTLHLWDYPDDGSVRGRCCAPEDVHDARRVADFLNIRHYAFDRRVEFERDIVEPFVESYLRGETPSPCVHCNRSVKLSQLFALAAELGAERVATGHFARVERHGAALHLLRARDLEKDQSYFLHTLTQAELARLELPLGESTKAEVRAEAERLGLPGAGKGESQELCFVPTGRYDELVATRAESRVRPGPIVDGQGKVLGRHEGIHRFTVGQRRNLGVALGERAFVVALEPKTATVRLGSAEELLRREALLDMVSLAEGVRLPLRAEVAVRYRGTAHAAEVAPAADGRAALRFDEPVRAVVPGQFAVFYAGDRVLGGGRIRRAAEEAV
jgi:tRNA-specific 2-thiouridylase